MQIISLLLFLKAINSRMINNKSKTLLIVFPFFTVIKPKQYSVLKKNMCLNF